MKNYLNKDEIELLKISGKILKESLLETAKHVRARISTLALDEIATDLILKKGGVPAFKNYKVSGAPAFPASLCVSVNDEVVHGIPTERRILKDGDIVGLDLGVGYKGIYTDMAITVPVGNISAEADHLIKTTRIALKKGIEGARINNHIGEIGHRVQAYAENHNCGVVRDLVGHGIGKLAHMDPQIPNYGEHWEGPVIKEGMALAIEPMLTTGGYDVKIDSDRWTIRTKDGSLSAHFEHTVVISDGKTIVVTA